MLDISEMQGTIGIEPNTEMKGTQVNRPMITKKEFDIAAHNDRYYQRLQENSQESANREYISLGNGKVRLLKSSELPTAPSSPEFSDFSVSPQAAGGLSICKKSSIHSPKDKLTGTFAEADIAFMESLGSSSKSRDPGGEKITLYNEELALEVQCNSSAIGSATHLVHVLPGFGAYFYTNTLENTLNDHKQYHHFSIIYGADPPGDAISAKVSATVYFFNIEGDENGILRCDFRGGGELSLPCTRVCTTLFGVGSDGVNRVLGTGIDAIWKFKYRNRIWDREPIEIDVKNNPLQQLRQIARIAQYHWGCHR